MLYIILAGYLVVMIGIGVYCRYKSASVSDYVLGGRSVGGWITAFAYGTSYFSAQASMLAGNSRPEVMTTVAG